MTAFDDRVAGSTLSGRVDETLELLRSLEPSADTFPSVDRLIRLVAYARRLIDDADRRVVSQQALDAPPRGHDAASSARDQRRQAWR